MRDERGRYHVRQAHCRGVPEWANSCDKCWWGIVPCAPLHGGLRRCVNALRAAFGRHRSTFCTAAVKPTTHRWASRRRRLIEGRAKDQRTAAARNNTADD